MQKNDFPLTEELPYSVFLERYKEESRAENAESRLEAQGIDSYIVKKYDDETLMSFDLHSGAFSSEEEAEGGGSVPPAADGKRRRSERGQPSG